MDISKLLSHRISEIDMIKELCDGHDVVFYGLNIRAVEVTGDKDPCDECQLFSICRYEMANLCQQCDNWTHKYHQFQLVDG